MERRAHVRYDPDENAVSEIIYHKDKKEIQKIGLIFDESFSGCSVVLTGNVPFKVNERVLIKSGKLDSRYADVCWIRKIESGIFKIGIAYGQS
ncbi:MAG: hypothetical protein KAR07_02025 [Spirochaetes bacterium]|nr:hypothetical protein [Spirochaetota bacterium]MCK5266921.1 hypothetical protein [Spirochaetota bacterium]